MSTQERLKRSEDIQIAYWLSPLPQLELAQVKAATEVPNDTSQEQVIGNYYATDNSTLPELGALSDFENWASVASTIDYKTRQLAGFDPTATEFDVKAWEEYLYKFGTSPFLLSTEHRHLELSLGKDSIKPLIHAVFEMIKGVVSEADYDHVLTTMKKMATLAITNEGKAQKDSYQQLGIISVKSSKLYSLFIRTCIQMTRKEEEDKDYEHIAQTLSVIKFQGIIDFDKCKRNADLILGWDRFNIDKWVEHTNSYNCPPNECPSWSN
ncbi:MAG: hypothetical protein F6K36_10925 [Symploca sp. SIO3C6]|nr:hypothetical protein [Symploca sp. SIO3C6]